MGLGFWDVRDAWTRGERLVLDAQQRLCWRDRIQRHFHSVAVLDGIECVWHAVICYKLYTGTDLERERAGLRTVGGRRRDERHLCEAFLANGDGRAGRWQARRSRRFPFIGRTRPVYHLSRRQSPPGRRYVCGFPTVCPSEGARAP